MNARLLKVSLLNWKQSGIVVAKVALVVSLYVVTAIIGIQVGATQNGFVTPVWAPSGIAFAFVLAWGRRYAFAVLLGALISNVFSGAPFLWALVIACGNSSEALIGVHFLRREKFELNFMRFKPVLAFIVVACSLGPVFAASIGVLSLWFMGTVTLAGVSSAWLTWYVGDAIGILIVAPLILTFIYGQWGLKSFRSLVEVSVLNLLALGMLVFLFEVCYKSPLAVGIGMFPFMLWAAVTFGAGPMALLNFIIAVAALVFNISGHGPFWHGSIYESLFDLDLYISLNAVMGLTLTSAVGEIKSKELLNRQLKEQLEVQNNSLEKRIEQRTKNLHEAIGSLREELTARKRMENHLAFQDMVVRNLGEGMCVVRASDLVLVYCNPKFSELFGYDDGELIGKNIAILNASEGGRSGHTITKDVERSLVQDIENRFEMKKVRKDGSFFWARVRIKGFDHFAYGKVWVTLVEDIDMQRTTLKALRLSETRFRTLVEGVKEYAISLLDSDGKIVSWNTGAERIKGWGATEVLGQHFRMFFVDQDKHAKLPEGMLESACRDGRSECELQKKRKNGTLYWAQTLVTPLYDAAGALSGYSVITRDITDRKLAHEHLEETVKARTADLIQAIKSKDEFLSIASHELKTPLTALKLRLQLSRLDFSRDSQLKKRTGAFDEALKHVNALAELVDQLLDVSRLQSGQWSLSREQVDIRELIQDEMSRLEPQFNSSNVLVQLKLPDEPLFISCDPLRMKQVIRNLISNALKYAPGSPLELILNHDEAYAVVSVEDQGPGIPPEKQSTIFRRFGRANSGDMSGMGLGLYITKNIVESHGGSISVESRSKKHGGAYFVVRIPLLAHQHMSGPGPTSNHEWRVLR